MAFLFCHDWLILYYTVVMGVLLGNDVVDIPRESYIKVYI